MNVQLSDKDGNLKKELKELESIKPKSVVKTDVNLHQSIVKSLEAAMPQLSKLPI